MTAPYPLSAVVGQDDLKLALLLHAVDPKLGGVLIRGEKGSGKSTAARALATLLPATDDGAAAPFVELPIGATEDRVVGTLDLEGALLEGRSRLRPGLLAAAHRGVLYVDEVNLLADHLVDVLIDAAAFGVNRVERDGLTAEHPCRFVLVGSMNPEEGELRPQLLDRFGLAVEVRAPRDPELRTEVVRRRLAHDADPAAFADRFAGEEDAVRAAIAAAAALLEVPQGRQVKLPNVVVPDEVLAFTSRLCAELDAEGLRADLVLARGAAALAALDGRKEATADDVTRLAPLALAHRRRRGPLDAPGLSPEELADALDRVGTPDAPSPEPGGSRRAPGDDHSGATPAADEAHARGGSAAHSPGGHDAERPDRDGNGTHAQGGTGAAHAQGGAGQAPDRDGSTGDAPGADRSSGRGPDGPEAGRRPGLSSGPGKAASPASGLPLALKTTRPSGVLGRRNRGTADRGGIVAARPSPGGVTDIAVAATVQAAAARRAASRAEPAPGTAAAERPNLHQAAPPTTPAPAAVVERADLRQAIREARTANLVILCVDASGSMGATERMEAAKGAAVSLLLDAYQRRDRVALVTFAGDAARVVLRPTGSVEVARARLADLPTGGRTPLGPGLRTALDVARSARHRDPDRRPVIVVVTDGRATSVGTLATTGRLSATNPTGATNPSATINPTAAALAAAAEIAAAGIEALVVDAEDGDIRLGLARRLAEAMNARYTALPDLAADALTRAVRTVVPPD